MFIDKNFVGGLLAWVLVVYFIVHSSGVAVRDWQLKILQEELKASRQEVQRLQAELNTLKRKGPWSVKEMKLTTDMAVVVTSPDGIQPALMPDR